MRILFVHNSYSDINPSGEEIALQELASILEGNGHVVRWYRRNSDEIRKGIGPLKAFFTGIYNPFSANIFARVLDEFNPDVVQVQNLYPLISSSIFKPIRKRGIPVVMRCPNYRLFCPNGLCLNPKGEACEKCFGGKEWNCILHNCERNLFKSLGYAIRNAYSRTSGNVEKGVNVYIVQSEFQKRKFVQQGVDEKKIAILPGICPEVKDNNDRNIGEYVGFVGRVSIEKGIYEFIEAAKMNPSIPFKVAGRLDDNFVLPNDCPVNLEFIGFLSGDALDEFYIKSRIIVVPSKWYEGFPNVITRAMMLKKPVITTDIGAMPSIIDHGINGYIFKHGDCISLSKAISSLYSDLDLCKEFGDKGKMKAASLYSRDSIYSSLKSIYEIACNARVINKG